MSYRKREIKETFLDTYEYHNISHYVSDLTYFSINSKKPFETFIEKTHKLNPHSIGIRDDDYLFFKAEINADNPDVKTLYFYTMQISPKTLLAKETHTKRGIKPFKNKELNKLVNLLEGKNQYLNSNKNVSEKDISNALTHYRETGHLKLPKKTNPFPLLDSLNRVLKEVRHLRTHYLHPQFHQLRRPGPPGV